MNREEILARSREENAHKPDEREQAIEQKSKSAAQIAGLIICLVYGVVGFLISDRADSLLCGIAIYNVTLAYEWIVKAVTSRNDTRKWLLAALTTVLAIAATGMFISCSVMTRELVTMLAAG